MVIAAHRDHEYLDDLVEAMPRFVSAFDEIQTANLRGWNYGRISYLGMVKKLVYEGVQSDLSDDDLVLLKKTYNYARKLTRAQTGKAIADDVLENFLDLTPDWVNKRKMRKVFHGTGNFDERSKEALPMVLERYFEFYETFIDRGEFVSFRRFLIDFDQRDDPNTAVPKRGSQSHIQHRVEQWLANSEGDFLDTLYVVVDDSSRERLEMIHSGAADIVREMKMMDENLILNELVSDYLTQYALAFEEYEHVSFRAFLLDKDKMCGTRYTTKFGKLGASLGKDDSLTSRLNCENRDGISGIAFDYSSFYSDIINSVVNTYLEFADKSWNKNFRMFSLWTFFSEYDPKKNFESAYLGRRKGPLLKLNTWFNQHKDAHGFDDFNEWVISNLNDDVKELVREFPQELESRNELGIDRVASLYMEFASHYVFSRLHYGSKGKVGIRLSPRLFFYQSNFSTEDSDSVRFVERPKLGSFGSICKMHTAEQRKRTQEGSKLLPDLDAWTESFISSDNIEKYLLVKNYMVSLEPEIQEEAFKVFYPAYLDLCNLHGVPDSKKHSASDFARVVFPEYYESVSGKVATYIDKKKFDLRKDQRSFFVESLEPVFDCVVKELDNLQHEYSKAVGKKGYYSIHSFGDAVKLFDSVDFDFRYMDEESNYLLSECYREAVSVCCQKKLEPGRESDVIGRALGVKKSRIFRRLFDERSYDGNGRKYSFESLEVGSK